MNFFVLTAEQIKKLEDWLDTQRKPPVAAIGGSLTYSFTPNSVGCIIKVRNWNGQEIDLTDYDSW